MKYLILLTLICLNTFALVNYNCKTYLKVGSITSKSNISRAELKKLIKEVEYEWERGLGLNFLEYSEKKGIPVNIVYDSKLANIYESEKLRDEIEEMATQLQKIENRKEKEKRERDSLYYIVVHKKEAFLKLHSSKQRVKAHKEINLLITKLNKQNSKVQSIVDEYNRLNHQRNDLINIINNLTPRKEYHAGITKSNSQTRTYYHGNKAIRKSTEITVEKIDIYKYKDKNELKKILAHEIGHAFGIKEHLSKAGTLMHRRTSSKETPFKITTNDILYAQRILLNKCKR